MLKKPFLRHHYPMPKPTVFRIVMGLLFGLMFTFAFYALLYFTREFFRYYSLADEYELLLLSDRALGFYNLFFAYIAVIAGQSFFFLFLFYRPAVFFAKNKVMRHSLINEQRSLNWFFISWFGKLAVSYGLIFGIIMPDGFYEFSFYPSYGYLFVLMVLVLFFHPWMTIRRLWPGSSLKWMLVSLLVVSLLSFGLSKMQLLDHKQLESKLMSKNIHTNYLLELPESNVFSKPEKRTLTEKIYYVFDKNDSLLLRPFLVANHTKMTTDSLIRTLNAWSLQRYEADRNFMTWKLYIHRDIKMGQVSALKKAISAAGHRRIAFVVRPEKSKIPDYFPNDNLFVQLIPPGYAGPGWIKTIQTFLDTVPSYITLHQDVEGTVSMNGKIVDGGSIQQHIIQFIHTNPNGLILLQIHPNTTFGDYIAVLSAIRQGINDWRNLYALQTYGLPFERLSMDNYQLIYSRSNYWLLEYIAETYP